MVKINEQPTNTRQILKKAIRRGPKVFPPNIRMAIEIAANRKTDSSKEGCRSIHPKTVDCLPVRYQQTVTIAATILKRIVMKQATNQKNYIEGMSLEA